MENQKSNLESKSGEDNEVLKKKIVKKIQLKTKNDESLKNL